MKRRSLVHILFCITLNIYHAKYLNIILLGWCSNANLPLDWMLCLKKKKKKNQSKVDWYCGILVCYIVLLYWVYTIVYTNFLHLFCIDWCKVF